MRRIAFVSPGLHRRAFLTLGLGTAGALLTGGGGLAYAISRINRVGDFSPDELGRVRSGGRNALFEAHPVLARSVPWRPIGTFPTPVEEMPAPTGAGDIRLFVKRDDLSSALYGGNKVRKLEHFLAEAELASRRTLVTLGGVGSNHALATARHAAALGLHVDLVLYDQPPGPAVSRNLGGFLAADATLHYAGSIPNSFLTARRVHRRRSQEGEKPYFIMVGGTSRLGCIGYVSAAYELAEQVRRGALPEPDRLFVPLGTCGTAAGLVAGFKILGMRTRVTAVRVADAFVANRFVLRHLAQDVAAFLHAADRSVPPVEIGEADFDLVTGYLGTGYGYSSSPAEAALRWASPQLALDTTYTGKALAACLDYCRRAPDGTTALFLNTFNSAPVPSPPTWNALPRGLNRFVQPRAATSNRVGPI
jgi:D-cysteine desulfhydrase